MKMETLVHDQLVVDEHVNVTKQKRTPQTSESVDAIDVDIQKMQLDTFISVDEKKKQHMQPETSEFVVGKKSETDLDPSDIDVCYVLAAFRSICPYEVFIFTGYEYVVVKYDPATAAKDSLVKGPIYIRKGFPSISDFQTYGVDAAFSRHGTNRAFLFCLNECVEIEYGCDTKKGRVLCREFIADMFPAFRGTTFAHHVDAAFESTEKDQAYFFSNTQYALINYVKGSLIATAPIVDAFPCLENTMFERDIGAAFASHTPNEAYLFKDDKYARLHFTPGETKKSYIIEGPMDIVPTNWPSLETLLPCQLGFDEIGISSSEDEHEIAVDNEFRCDLDEFEPTMEVEFAFAWDDKRETGLYDRSALPTDFFDIFKSPRRGAGFGVASKD